MACSCAGYAMLLCVGAYKANFMSVFLNPVRLNPSSREKDSAVPCDVLMVGIKLNVREVLATVEFGNESACWLVLRKNGKKILLALQFLEQTVEVILRQNSICCFAQAT